MYHSVNFGDKNTWDDWHLIPSSRPLFNPPAKKEKIIDVPGMDGDIDLSTALTGYPVYENRTGSIEFYVVNGYKEWYEAYSDIMDYLHGQTMKAILDDDPEYYYEGRFEVNSWKSNKDYSKITIDYSVGPYKWLIHSSLEDWLWDPFNFETGIIPTNSFKSIAVSSTQEKHTYASALLSRAPVCPSFTVSTTTGQGITVKFYNSRTSKWVTKTLLDGTSQIPELIFLGDDVTLYFQCVIPSSVYTNLLDSSGDNILDSSGNTITGQALSSVSGTVSIDFRQGRL